MIMQKTAIFFLFAAATLCAAEVNVLKNSGFEDMKHGRALHWGYDAKDKVHTAFDAEVKHSGKYSLRVTNPLRYCSVTQGSFKTADFKKDIIIRGWAKYKGMEKTRKDGTPCIFPFVGIWSYCKGRNSLNFNVIPISSGDRDWFRFETRLKAADFHKKVSAMSYQMRPDRWGFRINVYKQSGTLWIDDLEMVFVDPVIFNVLLDRNSVSGDDIAKLTVETGEKGVAAVADASGKKIFSRQFDSGKSTITLPFASWKNGSYTVTVTAGKNSKKLNIEKVADAFDE